MKVVPDKWTAFWLSLIIPGAGQLAARSWSAAPWLLAGVGLALLLSPQWFAGSVGATVVRVGVFTTLGLLSAEHAKRLLENRRPAADKPACRRYGVACRRSRGRAIDVLVTLEFPRPCQELWPIIADLPTFLVIDPFHDRVILQSLPAAKGVDLVLSHNAFGSRFLRFGRIIAWNEGSGYTFSDLSGRNKTTGFPHVFRVAIRPGEAAGDSASTLTIRVRGRWTSKVFPSLIGRLWVTWVCREHARLLAKAL